MKYDFSKVLYVLKNGKHYDKWYIGIIQDDVDSLTSYRTVEHVDGNSANHGEDNLKLLCPNCDSLTSTYKALNRGNGRFKRRDRYKDGKSF